jgi:superfamily II DNA/RNA helicase
MKKSQKEILDKLGIEALNSMQEDALLGIEHSAEIVLLSATGTGKTLAFLLPILQTIDPNNPEVQSLILVPSRELAIQIEQVLRDMGSGFKVNAVYGGRPIAKDKEELKHPPAIVIGTPGRLNDHLRRGTFSSKNIKFLVLDEFDKSLEIGFEEDMKEIIQALPKPDKIVLTSATQGVEIPDFVGIKNPLYIDYLGDTKPKLEVKTIISPSKDKLETLFHTICHLGNQPGIVFCNFKDSIERVSNFLDSKNIAHGCFHGGMEQTDRERVLIKFRNGTIQLIIATDLAARGLDIPEIKFIIHYHLPLKKEEFIHRNGRTARMHREGSAYLIKWSEEVLPDFIKNSQIQAIEEKAIPEKPDWTTVFVSGGRRDKISKSDIAGLFSKQGKLGQGELGLIELKQDCAFVAVKSSKLSQLLTFVDNVKLKNKKVRVKEI